MKSAFDLSDRVAVVTGSSRGIGRDAVEMLARAGASMVASSRISESCEPVAAELTGAGRSATAIPCHIGPEGDLRQLVDTTLNRFGHLDILVCNAAINSVYRPMSDLTQACSKKSCT